VLSQSWFQSLAALALAGCAGALPASGVPPALPRPDPGAYHGGALLVTDPAAVQGHLAPGQVLPIRLSRLPSDPAGALEAPDSVRYGQLVFLEVAPGTVTFRAAFLQAGGGLGPSRTVTLRLGDQVDLCGCGHPDLALEYPIQPLTAAGVQVTYSRLAFRCDDDHDALFALDPHGFPGARYPFGICALTPDGHFIFQPDGPGLSRPECPAVQERRLEAEPAPGDVVVETQESRVRRIEAASRSGGRWRLRYARTSAPRLFPEVFGAAFVCILGSPKDLARRYGGPGPLPPQLAGDRVVVNTTRTLMDNQYGRLDLHVAADLGADLSLTAHINRRGLTAQVGATADEALRLAADYRLDRAFHQDFGSWTLANPTMGFAVNGVPISFSLPVTGGLALDLAGTGRALEGLKAEGRWRWTANLDARWGWRGARVDVPPPVTDSSMVVEALPENHAEFSGKADLRPWIAVAPTLGVAGMISGACPTTLSAAGEILGAAPGGLALDAQCQLGLGLTLDLPLVGKVWKHDWALYTWNGRVWPNAPAATSL